MMMHKITPSVYYNYWLKRFDTQLHKPTNQNSIKVPKVVKPTNMQIELQDFRDQCNKQPLSPPFLHTHTKIDILLLFI